MEIDRLSRDAHVEGGTIAGVPVRSVTTRTFFVRCITGRTRTFWTCETINFGRYICEKVSGTGMFTNGVGLRVK